VLAGFGLRALLILAIPVCAACSPAGTETTTAPPPAADLGELFASKQYQAVVDAAPAQLESARARGATPTECWQIEHVYLLALAHIGPADRIVERWRVDSVEFAEVIPMEFRRELLWHSHAVTTGDDWTTLVRATSTAYQARWLDWFAKQPPREANLFGHPEGFPKAWLAPDERPAELSR
jgi:hypothetical protein